MRARAGISTSDIHFIISKPVSAVRADATEVPTSRHKSSSTNGLAATGPQSGSNLKNFRKTIFRLHYDQKNTLNPLVKSVFKSVHNHRRYLHFCDRHVCCIQYAATRRLQLRAWPILCTGLCPAQLFLVIRYYLVPSRLSSDPKIYDLEWPWRAIWRQILFSRRFGWLRVRDFGK